MLVNEFAHQFVVPFEESHPGPVAHAFVQRGRLLDVGEQDDDIAVAGQPGKVGPFHLGPVGEFLDRAAHRGAEPLFADQVGGLPHGLDRFAAAGHQLLSGIDAASQLVSLAAGPGEQHPQRRQADRLDGGDRCECPDDVTHSQPPDIQPPNIKYRPVKV